MPAATADTPAVALSFANNFWGKDDAGVGPLLERMQTAKQTCDELKSFYSARASIEDEYAKKLLSLCRKSLGSHELGSLKISLDTVRGEVECMAKQHQAIAAQMKSELDEPLAAFSGGMKERRKIVQNTVEKLLKTKIQQTQQLNKSRDKYEQECLKIKGYLAQGHMVMGQEERRNKAKLEKTQISLATTNSEYESAVKVLEETTARWNREWKAAADKFQDLEEERLDFTKSSLWTFANIASTVCVSDDASCEKVRLSLENMEVEKDIINFITEKGTGQEIPDAPKYINFCRGDVNDAQSEVSEDDNYSVAQFPRSINPAFRSSSPQPSTLESHHDPNSMLANDMAHREMPQAINHDVTGTPHRGTMRGSMDEQRRGAPMPPQYDAGEHGPISAVPHDPYPMDGMTMLCRTGPSSDRSSQPASARPSSRESHSDYSNPTSMSSVEPDRGKASPIKHEMANPTTPEKRVLKKKSGFFQNHSPFRRKSTREAPVTDRRAWGGGRGEMDRTASPEPIDANASLALGVGQNVLPVTTPDMQRRGGRQRDQSADHADPIAAALAELKEVNLGKQSSVRMSADHYHGMATPAPGSDPRSQRSAAHDGYGASAPVSRLGVPPPAVTSRAMKEASKKVADQTREVFGQGGRGQSPGGRPGTRGYGMPRAASPAPVRSASPQPGMNGDPRYRSASPNPYGSHQRNQSMPQPRGSDQGYYRGSSPNADYGRPRSSYGGGEMAVQLAPAGDDRYGSQRGRGGYEKPARQRSKSVAAGPRHYSRDGRPVMHYARALYMYQAAIPEELGFGKGDILAVIRHQDDGWWEAEVHGGQGRVGLVPSNYLQPC